MLFGRGFDGEVVTGEDSGGAGGYDVAAGDMHVLPGLQGDGLAVTGGGDGGGGVSTGNAEGLRRRGLPWKAHG